MKTAKQKNMKVMSLQTRELLEDGKRKLVYQGDNNDQVILSFKDTAFPNSHEIVSQSGVFYNRMSETIFRLLKHCYVPNHFVSLKNLREQVVLNTSVFPFFVRVTNVVTDPAHALFDFQPGTSLNKPLVEFMCKKDNHIQVIEPSYLQMFDWCRTDYLEKIKSISLKVNDALQAFFFQYKKVAHIHLKFGLFTPQYTFQIGEKEEIILIDDFTLFNVFFWCTETHRLMEINMNLLFQIADHMKINVDNLR